MSRPTASYAQRLDNTPEAELSALASVYRFILDCHAKKNAASVDSANGDDVKESKNESRRKDIIPNTN
jgi:hypothetical protein